MTNPLGDDTLKPVRQVFDDAPAMIPVPEALRHRKLELIFWPLEDASDNGSGKVGGRGASPSNLRTRRCKIIMLGMN
jgi:hypothetical protein